MKSIVADLRAFDWEGDRPLKHSFRATVIYEMHVAGFTCHPNSGVAKDKRGTYLGILEKIPYLQYLGITAVELLPVFQYDPQDAAPGLDNYWGYGPVSFFAPHLGYCTCNDPLICLNEFRTMVKELHRAGIEVILDGRFISGRIAWGSSRPESRLGGGGGLLLGLPEFNDQIDHLWKRL